MSAHHDDSDPSSPTPTGQSRRGFLRSTALAGAGAAAVGALGEKPALAAGPAKAGLWRPDSASQQFTIAVMPDTQFLYWGSQNRSCASSLLRMIYKFKY